MTGECSSGAARSELSQTLFLPSLNSVPVLTCDDLDLRGRNVLIRLHLERRIFHQERPHVIA
jgi:hypothetical protein